MPSYRRLLGFLSVLGLFVGSATTALAATPGDRYTIEQGLLQQYYVEHNDPSLTGITLPTTWADRETGTIAYLGLRWHHRFQEPFVLDAAAAYAAGDTHYHGYYLEKNSQGNYVMTDKPASATSSNVMLFAHVDLAYRLPLGDSLTLLPTLSTGFDYWRRDVSYVEYYSNMYLLAGLRLEARLAPRLRLGLEALGGRILASNITAYFPGDTYSSSLGAKPRSHYAVSLDYRLDTHWQVGLRVSQSAFKYARGDIDSQGLFEPNSKTTHTVAAISLAYRY